MVKRSSYIDILKAIGIVAIVIGHASSGLLNAFVYSFHLMVFFFVVGLCFSDKKAEHPGEFLGKYVIKLLILYIIYNTFFVVFHNLFVKWNLCSEMWSTRQIIEALFYPLTFSSADPFLGAFWFIPMFLTGLFIYIVSFSLAIKTKNPDMTNLAFLLLWGIGGLLMNSYEIVLGYHLQTSFLAVPMIYAGYYAKRYWSKIEKSLNLLGCLISVAVILPILHYVGRIELAANQIIDVWLFYPVTLVGIWFCCCLAQIINRRKCAKIIAGIGKNSFHIMALHFLAFKLVDAGYCIVQGITDHAIISRYPNSGFSIHILYWLGGVVISVGIATLAQYIWKNIRKMVE